MLTRVVSALVMAVVALLAIFQLPNMWFSVAALLLMLMGLYEWRVLCKQSLESYIRAAVLLSLLAAITYYVNVPKTWILAVACCYWLWQTTRLSQPIKLGSWSLVRGVFALWFAWVALSVLHLQGPATLLMALMMVWAADSLAYFGGKRFGKNKLAPSISPGKTWEGVASGVIGSVVLSLVYAAYFLIDQISGFEFVLLVLLAMAVSFISVVGDLSESKLKRAADMKDSGNLIPGHGGVLDRIDGLIAGLPIFAFSWPIIMAIT